MHDDLLVLQLVEVVELVGQRIEGDVLGTGNAAFLVLPGFAYVDDGGRFAGLLRWRSSAGVISGMGGTMK